MSTSPADPVLAALAENPLLLTQDRTLPSVVGILTGERLHASWWSHPRAHSIYATLTRLADHPDVLFAKLLHGKDTLIYRPLWPALVAVGQAREPWQTRDLSAAAGDLVARLDRGESPLRAAGTAVREIERRLLAVAEDVHTESGRHQRALESWTSWAARVGCVPLRSVLLARRAVEDAAARLGAPSRALPWPEASGGAGAAPNR